MGISSFSTQYLPRNAMAIGVAAIILGILYIWGGITNSLAPSLIEGIVFLIGGIMFFCLAKGVSKKERWASVFGVILMGLAIIDSFLRFSLGPASLLGAIISAVIAILLLISFIRSLKEVTANSISIFPFIVTIIGFCLIIVSWVFLLAWMPK